MVLGEPVAPLVERPYQYCLHLFSRLRSTSGPLVLVVPDHRLPELDLVPIRIHDPRELAVLVRFGSADDFHSARTKLREHLAEVVDSVVDHEGRITWAEPLAVAFRDMPHREAPVLGSVVRPFEDSTSKVLQRHAQMLLIPGCQRGATALALEEDAADSSDLCHRRRLLVWPRSSGAIAPGWSHPPRLDDTPPSGIRSSPNQVRKSAFARWLQASPRASLEAVT